MNIKLVIGIPVVAVLFFFGIIFAMASVYEPTRLIVAAMLLISGFVVILFVARKPPPPIVQRLEVSGDMKAVALKCPNCSATVDATRVKIVSGVPYATCPYCGHSFEVTEEPKW